MTPSTTGAAARWRREALAVTDAVVLHADDRAAALRELGRFQRSRRRAIEAQWQLADQRAAETARQDVALLVDAVTALRAEVLGLEALGRSDLRGRGEGELRRLEVGLTGLAKADEALQALDFGAAGRSTDQVVRSLAAFGGQLALAVTAALSAVPLSRAVRAELATNHDRRLDVEHALLGLRGTTAALGVLTTLLQFEAEGLRVAAGALVVRAAPGTRRRPAASRGVLPVVGPEQLETFADVAGLDDTVAALEQLLGPLLRGEPAGTWRNGVLLHGPPGTGKTLLSRAFAGEHGLRHLKVTPAALASGSAHGTAANLAAAFAQAAASTPCVLLLDEVDVLAGHRSHEASADQREVVTQLMTSLEEHRDVPGLVVMAATNELDRLDPGLREGRFDLRLHVPLPDVAARAEVLRVHLEQRGCPVDDLELVGLARATSGRSGAALESLVVRALQAAIGAGEALEQRHLQAVLAELGGTDRIALDDRLGWDDVVLGDLTRKRLTLLLKAFTDPERAGELGVEPPSGLLLWGPPGTGKTTVAKVLASVADASFLEVSASDLLSKYAGESEQRVSRLFERARSVRPTIVFLDEADGLLRRRRPDSATPWDDRVVNEFLRQLDGLRSTQGVLLVAATNRPDVLDEAVLGRRLLPIEIGLPDDLGRRRLLELLTRGSRLARDVDLEQLADATAGLSGAELRSLRDAAGLRALGRRARTVSAEDFAGALGDVRGRTSLAQV